MPKPLEQGEAWADFCDRMKAAGARLLEDDFPQDARTRAEGFRHLTRLMNYATQWYVDFHDSEFPRFHRYDDDVTKWGGPNTDNHYLRAKIDPAFSYRVTANVRGLRQMILSTPEGEMQFGQMQVFEERSLDDFEVGADGAFEVVLGGAEQPGNWVPLHPQTDHLLIRLYLSDWEKDAAPAFHIVKIGNEGRAPQAPAPQDVARGLAEAAHWVEVSSVFWKDYLVGVKSRGPANVLGPPFTPPGGSAEIAYGGGWFALDESEALIIEFEKPHAQYWSFQLYAPPFFESLDMTHRSVSLNDAQTDVDSDGKVRLVVSAKDPGIANWLDTEGRPEGMLSYRWIWAKTLPVPVARKVALADVETEIPASTRRITADERRTALARRAASVSRRFRR